MFETKILIIVAILVIAFQMVLCSVGDRLPYFRKCVEHCRQLNCSTTQDMQAFNARQPHYMLLIGWDCPEECRHQCQWRTVTQLLREGVQYQQLPQFYGKWTFIRMYGIEEPASVLFSVLNLISNLYGYNNYRKSIKSDPYFMHWTIQTLLTINAWFWSAVFHIRQSTVTEKLDYFSAYSLVIYSLYTITVRFLDYFKISWSSGLLHMGVAVPFLAFFVYHIYYLFYIHFDYGYNMRVNVITGVLSSMGWFLWCFILRRKRTYVWKCVFSLFLLNALLLLEVYDFPPMAFILDAHSLWHLGTIAIPLVWFSYLSDEANNSEIVSKQICDKNDTKIY